MTAKRFTIEKKGGIFYIFDTGNLIPVLDGQPICDLLNELHEENSQLKAQLLYDGDGVCNICKHQCLVKTGKYYVARCEKEHEECSKVDLHYCEDFELVRNIE